MRKDKRRIPENELRDLYESGLTMKGIGELFGVSVETVRHRMIEFGIRSRTPADALRGRVATADQREKIAAALRGQKFSPERKAKISLAAMGRAPWNKGKRKATHPELAGVGHPEDKHWAWKGGVSAVNNRIRQSSEYKAWRDAVFKRDNWTCVKCSRRGGNLEADHIEPFSTAIDRRFDVSNGQTLCRPCHKEKTHGTPESQRRDVSRSPEAPGQGAGGDVSQARRE